MSAVSNAAGAAEGASTEAASNVVVEGAAAPDATSKKSKLPKSLGSAMSYISDAAPLIVAAFLVLTSCFNQDIKVLVWLGCLLIGLGFIKLIQPHMNKDVSPCPPLPGFPYASPSATSFYLMFTLAYLVAPMQARGDYNWAAIVIFLALYGVDVFIKISGKCVTAIGVMAGTLLGIVYGFIAYACIKKAGGGKLLYYNIGSSNKEYCSKAKNQTFKCSVYKNGELISAL